MGGGAAGLPFRQLPRTLTRAPDPSTNARDDTLTYGHGGWPEAIKGHGRKIDSIDDSAPPAMERMGTCTSPCDATHAET